MTSISVRDVLSRLLFSYFLVAIPQLRQLSALLAVYDTPDALWSDDSDTLFHAFHSFFKVAVLHVDAVITPNRKDSGLSKTGRDWFGGLDYKLLFHHRTCVQDGFLALQVPGELQ